MYETVNLCCKSLHKHGIEGVNWEGKWPHAKVNGVTYHHDQGTLSIQQIFFFFVSFGLDTRSSSNSVSPVTDIWTTFTNHTDDHQFLNRFEERPESKTHHLKIFISYTVDSLMLDFVWPRGSQWDCTLFEMLLAWRLAGKWCHCQISCDRQ